MNSSSRDHKVEKVKKDDMKEVILHYEDKYIPMERKDTRMTLPMKKVATSQFHDYYEAQLQMHLICLRYFFEFTDMHGEIDSHDTARFLHLCKDNKKKQHLAAAFQLLLPGMPMIYYGDEYAMPGANDPDCRRGMYWDEEYQDKEMYQWYKKLMQIRKTHACIVEGEMIETIANDDEDD